jgi:hypothetical protein
MSGVSNKLYSNMFNPIVMFSVAGLCATIALALAGGFEAVPPWF